ncbi:hypothetical protein N7528_008889 [Penicillium herquei]|nr:hypothetical protein N7528_008889 [Penicillium herquei]
MADVIGTISAVIAIVDTAIKIYDSAQKDIKLSETFKVVRGRLPVILHTLLICKDNLEPRKDAIPEDVGEALEQILDTCEEKAEKLRAIFEKIIPGENDTRESRYLKVLRRFGKGSKVEELMLGLTEDVQTIVNHNMVNSANQQENTGLEDTVNEMKNVISVPDEEDSALSSINGTQLNNVNSGNRQQISDNGPESGKKQYSVSQLLTFSKFASGDHKRRLLIATLVTHRQKDDFGFHKPAGLCLGRAPFIPQDLFVGRDSELEDITDFLHPAQGVQEQRRVVLGGMGGIGKTQLSLAYAKSQFARGFYSSVLWLNAASETALKDSFRSIASLIFDRQLLDSEDIVRRIHQWLSRSDNTRWLLLFDNYDEPDQFKIHDYYPHTIGHGAILITTRCPDRVSGTVLHVKPFKSENIKDSLMILQTRSKRENAQSDPHAIRLAERLAGFPLALATAGAYLQRSTLTFERYLQEYETRWNIDPRHSIELQEYERTLYTTWDLSYARLKRNESHAAELLKLLAYFSNQSLWYELFRDGITKKSPRWLRKLVKNDLSFQGLMGVLTEYQFLEIHSESETWSMHNCVHDWTLAALNRTINRKYYRYALDCVDAAIDGIESNSYGHIAHSRLAGHAARLAHQRFLKVDKMFDPTIEYVDRVSQVSYLLQDQFQLAAAEQMLQQLIAGNSKGKALGSDHISILETFGNIGCLYLEQGRLDQAEQMLQRALTGQEKALGADHISTLETVKSIGSLYLEQDRLDQAEQMLQRTLAGEEKALGVEHVSTLETVKSIGELYRDQGKLDLAEQMDNRLALARR